MAEIRIFSYLPNPRIWKATIAARICGVEVEVRGAAPHELAGWLWDFDARPLRPDEPADDESLRVGTVGFKGAPLRKTRAFLEANPFGTVPAAFSPDGKTGIFESNSIMRAVGRLGEKRFPIYGRDAYEAARIDAFLDASLVFARDAQHYLLGLLGGAVAADVHARAREAFAVWMAGIDQGLAPDRAFLVGDDVTLADVCFVAELCLFSNERARGEALVAEKLPPILSTDLDEKYPRATRHFAKLRKHAAFAPDVEPYLAKLESRRG